MNWSEALAECPQAFLKLEEFSGKELRLKGMTSLIHNGYYRDLDGYFSERDLYDFFDTNGIFIELYIDTWNIPNRNDVGCFYVNIFNEKGVDFNIMEGDNFESRNKAETAAFKEAFKLLEKQLSK